MPETLEYTKDDDGPTLCINCEHFLIRLDYVDERDYMYWKCSKNPGTLVNYVTGKCTIVESPCHQKNQGGCADYKRKKEKK